MRRLLSASILGLVAVAALTAVIVVVVSSLGSEPGEERLTPALPPGRVSPGMQSPQGEGSAPATVRHGIEATSTLEPTAVFFGDTITARVDVVLDRRRVDPDSIRVTTNFLPWEIVGTPERSRHDAGTLTNLRTTYVLRCLTGPCVPPRVAAPLEFNPARVAFRRLGSGAGETADASLRSAWPLLTVYSRFAAAAFEDPRSLSTPWRSDVVTLPAVSWRVRPGLLLAVLVSVAALLALAGATLVFLAWPRRAPAPVPEPEPEPEPEPQLTPLELALVLLADAARADGVDDRRRSLELVAEALAEHGDATLAEAARRLAWSESTPPVEETSDLAVRVREALALELASESTSPEGNGRVVV